jgi:hypothetical protein
LNGFMFIHKLNCFRFLKRAKTEVFRRGGTAESADDVAPSPAYFFLWREYF